MSYKIAAPNEYLAITGMNMKNDLITKATWVWPFQRCTSFNVQPQDYTMNLQAMTREKLQFLLPAVFTVGPDVNQRGANYQHDDLACHQDDRGDSLMKYAMLLADSTVEKTTRASGMRQSVESIVKGIIEGETRVLVSSMTMEEIFTERELFKRRLFRNIQGKLDLSGLKIFNAKVKESRDAPNSVYFASLSHKAREGATHQARIDVAEAKLRSSFRDARRRSKQDHEIAKINAETAMQKTDRDVEGEQAEANPNYRKSTLLTDAAAYKTKMDNETLATADYSDTIKNTDAAAYRTKTDADACDYAMIKDVEANLTNKQNDANSLSPIADAYTKLTSAFGGSSGLLQYMMTGGGTYIEPAPSNRIRIPPGLAKICCLSGASAFIIGVAGFGYGGHAGRGSEPGRRHIEVQVASLMGVGSELGSRL
ncbi:hypothetical protein F4825DRAFT_467653 [Nemania diffusa]|nr:hypothetical protein F4825DRAFT_467653 [Nemania diffusa]